MIIRMTVNDNDFTYIIESFSSCMYSQDTCFPSDENMRKIYYDNKTFRELWCEITNGKGELCNEDEEIFIDIIKQKYVRYISNRFDDEEDTKKYLLDKFKVSAQKSITPHWENGEVVYTFVNAGGKHITL